MAEESRTERRPLRAIFFDIDDTLYSTTEFAARARRNAVEAMVAAGLRADVDAVLQELQEVIAEFSSNYGRHYDQLLKRWPKADQEGCNRSVLIAAGIIGYHRTKDRLLQPFPEVTETLARLSRTGCTLGVITSGREIKQAEKLLRLGLVEFLAPHAIFISEQIGIDKPNPKLYARACANLELDPEQCMYVGNHPVKDIDPPNRLGMVTVLYRSDNKYASLKGDTHPDYSIRSFSELGEICARDFGLDVSQPAAG